MINNAANGSNAPVSVTSTQLTFTVLSISANTATKLTWQNLRVRPAAGTPLARGNLTETGTATMAGVRTNSNFGALREISGAAQRLTINSQLSTINTAGVAFAQQPVISINDQFGNPRTTANGAADNVTVVTAAVATHSTASLSNLVGTLSTVSLNGLITFTNLSYNIAETITVQYSSPSIQSSTNPPIQVLPAPASQLFIAQQPASGVVGSNLAVQPIVVTRDPYGNNSSAGLPLNLNLSLNLNQGSGPLLGTTNFDIGASAGNGLVTFTDLRIDAAGTNKQLTATAAGMVSTASQTFTVTRADQTITFNSLANTVSISGNTASIIGAGAVTVRASQPGDTNYNAATSFDRSFTISQAPITVTADSKGRLYGATNPPLTGVLAGVQYGDNITATYTTAATQGSSIGSYPIVPSLNDPNNKLPNYQLSTTNGSLTVSSAALSVTASNASRLYGQGNPVFGGTLVGVQNGDDITAVYTTAATLSSGVGGYAIFPMLNDPNNKLPNYQLSTTNGSLTVSAAALSVTASNATRLYGQTNPIFSGSLVGVQNGDDISAVYTTAAAQGSAVGSYAITPALNDPNNKLPNYQLSTTNGMLTISASSLSVTASNACRLYGQTNPVFDGSLAGVQNGDNITAIYTSTATPSSPIGAYPITPVLSDPDLKLPNYLLSTINGLLTVTNANSVPVITAISVADDVASLSFTTDAGRSYQVEFKDSLNDAAWNPLTNLTGNGEVMSVSDETTTSDSRFYRVVTQ